MRILVCCWGVPKPDTNAGDQRFVRILAAMARRHSVDYCCCPPCAGDQADHLAPYIHSLARLGIRPLISAGDQDGPYWFERVCSREIYDLFFFEYWSSAEVRARFARRCQPWAEIVVDSVDVHFLREEAGESFMSVRSDRATYLRRKAAEIAEYRAAGAVIAVTREDSEALSRVGGIARVVIVPIICDTKHRGGGLREPLMLFVGGFNHPPNVDGITWFVREILPEVRNQVPSSRVLIAGANAPDEIRALKNVEGVEFLGYVPDVSPYLERAAVAIAPLRFGAGMKGKVTEAMAAGVPVVTTSFGAQGLGARSGDELFIADSASDFASATIRILQDADLAERVGRSGFDLVSKVCGPSAALEPLERYMDDVAARTSGRRARPFQMAQFFIAVMRLRLFCLLRRCFK